MAIALIEEDVTAALIQALKFVSKSLDKIDQTNRLTNVAIAAQITGGEYLGWRTQAEDAASPRSGTMRMGGSNGPTYVHLTPAYRVRTALRTDLARISDDLIVLLRRRRAD